MRRIVHAVAKNAAFDGSAIDSGIYLGGVGGCDDHKDAVKVGDVKAPLDPFKLAFEVQAAESSGFASGATTRSRTPVLSRLLIFSSATRARAHHQAAPSIEFKKDRQQTHALAPQSATPCGTGPVGRSRSTAPDASPARCARSSSFVWRSKPGAQILFRLARRQDSGAAAARSPLAPAARGSDKPTGRAIAACWPTAPPRQK